MPQSQPCVWPVTDDLFVWQELILKTVTLLKPPQPTVMGKFILLLLPSLTVPLQHGQGSLSYSTFIWPGWTLTVHNSDSSQWKVCFPGVCILLGPQKTEERTVAPWLESVSRHLGIYFTHVPSDTPHSTPVRTHELDTTRSTVALRIFHGVLILEASLKSGHWLTCYLSLLTEENVFIWLLKFRFSDKHLHKPVNYSGQSDYNKFQKAKREKESFACSKH